jgi:hypothetical protein
MQRVGRDAPLPNEMQGKWIDVDDPASELVIHGGEVNCFGEVVVFFDPHRDPIMLRVSDDTVSTSHTDGARKGSKG